MSEFKYYDEIQCIFDTDGHAVFYDNGDESSGVELSQALAVAEAADNEVKRLRESQNNAWLRYEQQGLTVKRLREALNLIIADCNSLIPSSMFVEKVAKQALEQE